MINYFTQFLFMYRVLFNLQHTKFDTNWHISILHVQTHFSAMTNIEVINIDICIVTRYGRIETPTLMK